VNDAYKQQVRLLLEVLPEVAKANCLAMHGGTAINLFVRDMPRLSIDIDLTFVELGEREEAINAINEALVRVKERVETLRPKAQVVHKTDTCKLQIAHQGAQIKIEVNMVGRGLLGEASKLQLCAAAQEEFDAFSAISVVSIGQLYGGKLCAALDRQHPRDFFDVRLLLDNEGFNDEIKQGFLYGLVCSNRPTHELLSPNLIDQQAAFTNQFEGMSSLEFTYEDFENTRSDLIQIIRSRLDDRDKTFLLDFNRLEPDWSYYDFQEYPSVKWKIQNLTKLRENNPEKYRQQLDALEGIIG
jgi:predicted nucleotidyltransferase component of viral defense system